MPRIAPAEPPFSDEVQAIIDRVVPDDRGQLPLGRLSH
jgi:hypothetical protein